MPRGGARPGAGRKKGEGPARTLARKKVLTALDNGTSPLDYMLAVMTGEKKYEEEKFKAAVAAAPYMHPRLAAVEHSGEIKTKHEDVLAELERIAATHAKKPNAQGSDVIN